VRDSREWFSDDYLDAASLVVRNDKTNVQVGISKGIAFGAGPRSRSDERQLFAVASYEFSRAFEVGTQLLARRDRTRKERPMWSFFEVSGRVDQALRYWGNVAFRRGRRDDGTKLGGWAFDTGATLRPWDGGPSFTASYAIGSGDRTPDDGVDNLYRQTGLEDNETRYSGVKRIQTFGELLDPELSNLRVLSLGLGWRWSAASFDAVHHVYMQDVPRTRATSSNLSLRPTGQYGVFGHEVDTVLTVRLRHGVDVTIVSGFYVPTPAQSGPYRPAFFWKPQVQFYF
jgi:alginate production protein